MVGRVCLLPLLAAFAEASLFLGKSVGRTPTSQLEVVHSKVAKHAKFIYNGDVPWDAVLEADEFDVEDVLRKASGSKKTTSEFSVKKKAKTAYNQKKANLEDAQRLAGKRLDWVAVGEFQAKLDKLTGKKKKLKEASDGHGEKKTCKIVRKKEIAGAVDGEDEYELSEEEKKQKAEDDEKEEETIKKKEAACEEIASEEKKNMKKHNIATCPEELLLKGDLAAKTYNNSNIFGVYKLVEENEADRAMHAGRKMYINEAAGLSIYYWKKFGAWRIGTDFNSAHDTKVISPLAEGTECPTGASEWRVYNGFGFAVTDISVQKYDAKAEEVAKEKAAKEEAAKAKAAKEKAAKEAAEKAESEKATLDFEKELAAKAKAAMSKEDVAKAKAKAEAEKAEAEKSQEAKAAAEKAEAAKKAMEQKATEKAVAEKAAAKKAVVEKAALKKEAKAAAEKVEAAKKATEKKAAEKAVVEKAAAKKAVVEKVAVKKVEKTAVPGTISMKAGQKRPAAASAAIAAAYAASFGMEANAKAAQSRADKVKDVPGEVVKYEPKATEGPPPAAKAAPEVKEAAPKVKEAPAKAIGNSIVDKMKNIETKLAKKAAHPVPVPETTELEAPMAEEAPNAEAEEAPMAVHPSANQAAEAAVEDDVQPAAKKQDQNISPDMKVKAHEWAKNRMSELLKRAGVPDYRSLYAAPVHASAIAAKPPLVVAAATKVTRAVVSKSEPVAAQAAKLVVAKAVPTAVQAVVAPKAVEAVAAKPTQVDAKPVAATLSPMEHMQLEMQNMMKQAMASVPNLAKVAPHPVASLLEESAGSDEEDGKTNAQIDAEFNDEIQTI